MSDEEKTLAKLEERSEQHADKIDKVENNQRWGILTILGLLAKAAFDYMTGGGK